MQCGWMRIEGWERGWWWWVSGGAGGVAQIMQQLHCNSSRPGRACCCERGDCVQRASVHQPSAWPGQLSADWPSGVPLCAGSIVRGREGLGVKTGDEKGLATCRIIRD